MTLDKALYILSYGTENLQTYLVAVSVIQEELNRREKTVEAMKRYYTECLRDLKAAHQGEVYYKSKYDKLKVSYDCEIAYRKALNKRSIEEAVKRLAEDIKMAFYYEFEEIIPSVMADKIDELVKERGVRAYESSFNINTAEVV